jgi:hypothetical protein
MIAENLARVRNNIVDACRRSGRNPDDVQLIAVSKTFGIEQIQIARTFEQTDFGENYAQELKEKRAALPDPTIHWHFIGHLQSNKVKYLVEYVHLIHTVDDVRLAEEIQKRAERIPRMLEVLIEVHTTNEATKSGVAPSAAIKLAHELATFKNIRVRGLMTMGPMSENPEDARPSYKMLRTLLEEGKKSGLQWQVLSMGMSHDYEVAIQEGATMVRVGTAIFGDRNKNQL